MNTSPPDYPLIRRQILGNLELRISKGELKEEISRAAVLDSSRADGPEAPTSSPSAPRIAGGSVCSWCHPEYAPGLPGSVSTTICPACLEQLRAGLEQRRERETGLTELSELKKEAA